MNLYLINKYTGCEQASVEESMQAVAQLLEKGFYPFSPILHTHFYEEWRQRHHICALCGGKLIWYLGLKDGVVQCDDCKAYFEHKKRKDKYKQPDYYAWDLALLTSWLRKDDGCCNLVICNQIGIPCHKCNTRNQYDSGVVAVVLPSAYHMESSNNEIQTYIEVKIWDSKGAKLEYTFCKEHHILVITLETALNQPPEDWRNFAL
jgi:hypothetical protein